MEDVYEHQDSNVNPTDHTLGTPVSASDSIKLSDIEVLKDRFEQQKATKLKAEQIGSTLSRIKAREKASRRTSKTGEKKVEDGESIQTTKRSGTNSSNALKEKTNLLKKKLEEDRAKFEIKKGQEDLGRVSQIVEHIRVQLEDQDKTIQQIHSNFPATVKPIQEELTPPELNVPAEIKQKISDLEMKILDLQENLKEKDSVISARTQAITLLSEDMARKGKNTLDTLEETRSQMRTMQANFAALEDRMGEERARLRDQLDANKLKLQQLDKNYRSAESARFDLSTRNAELVEKVVTLQTKNLALEEEIHKLEEVVKESESKIKELKEAAENSNKQTIKIKAQFKAKLKSLEEERDLLRKEQNSNEEMNRLCERIAELEDEKGNLQLHLVDFDEIQEAGNILKERIAEMEEKLLRQESDLDYHLKAIRLLEADKLQLIEDASKINSLYNEKDTLIKTLQAQINAIEENKIFAEIKCVDLEEKLDAFLETQHELESELESTKNKLAYNQEELKVLTEKLNDRQSDISSNNQLSHIAEMTPLKNLDSVSSDLIEWQNKYSALEGRLNSNLVYCEELEDRKKAVEYENEKLLSECGNLRDTIDKLTCIVNSRAEVSDQDSSIVLKQNLEQKQMEITESNKHNKALEDEVDNLRHALQSTTEHLHQLTQQVEEMNSTQQKVEELSASLEERSRKLSEYKKFHKLKSEDVLRISHELDSVTTTSQQRISDLEESLRATTQTSDDLRKEVEELKGQINKGSESVNSKLQEQSLKMKKLVANLKLKSKLVKDLEGKIEELADNLTQKSKIISHLEEENSQIKNQSSNNTTVPQEFIEIVDTNNIAKERCLQLEHELSVLRAELELKSEQLECLKESSNTNVESHLHIKELENQNMKLTDISETKADQLKKMEDEISELNALNKSLMSELENMQDTYKQDALKNESVLDVFESEMMGSKKDILELDNQLQEVNCKYQQAWAKLQEKEAYIEDLENQLEKVKSRLVQIESTVESRRRFLEEKSDTLGERLNLAEKNNEKLERYEGELEQKIAEMLNNEEILYNVIKNLQDENNELSRSVNEALNKNLLLSQNLENEQHKVKNLTDKVSNIQARLTSYDNMAEEFVSLKTELKEAHECSSNKIHNLESRLYETEQCLESETQRLLDQILQLEGQRQESSEKHNSLLIEKQVLEEELNRIQQTIVSVTTDELEQLKNSHNNLTSELNKELDKRQTYINRIQELESQVKLLSSEDTLSKEIVYLKGELSNQIKENERLRYEVVKENARQQVEDVLSKAEAKYLTMGTPPVKGAKENELQSSTLELFTTPSISNEDPLTSAGGNVCKVNVSELDIKLSDLLRENNMLKLHLHELECSGKNIVVSKGLLESDDWASVSKDEDDGWGWGSKDAVLDQEHNIEIQNTQVEREERLLELNRKLSSYEAENRRLTDELKASHTKCSKLIKKLKELKAKSENLERSSRERSVGLDNLDLAMQEELKSQIEKLEKTLRDSNNSLNTFQVEKEGLLKKIDVLTSGNERLVEMKERQDIEVEMWQRRSNELENKVQGLEWAMAEFQSDQMNLNSGAAGSGSIYAEEERQHFLSNALEMEEKLNSLAAENDYLQTLVVELKEKERKYIADNSGQSRLDSKQPRFSEDEYSLLKEENVQLRSVIKDLENQVQEQCEHSKNDITDNLNRIDLLVKEDECISPLISADVANVCHLKEIEAVTEKYTLTLSENKKLMSKISNLNAEIMKLKDDGDSSKNITRNDLNLFSSTEPAFNAVESPTLFRGFTSVNEDSYQISPGFNQPLFIQTNDKQSFSVCPINPSGSNFFDTVELLQDSFVSSEMQQSHNIDHTTMAPANTSELEELNNLKLLLKDKEEELNNLLQEKETELNTLRDSVFSLQEENGSLKSQIELSSQTNEGPWGTFENVFSDELSPDKRSVCRNELNSINKLLEDKDKTIRNLRDQLNHTTTYLEKTGSDHKTVLTEEGSDLFSKIDDCRETEVNKYIEHITQLTNTQHDKEVEIKELTDRRKKCQELYNSLANKYECSPGQPEPSDKEQLSNENVNLNQLLEDKETELEMMSQQIEQAIIARENLQDEISMTLSEMEAASISYTISDKNKGNLMPQLQPENIEDISDKNKVNLMPQLQPENIEEVRTLCDEVEELTRLLQEKESEVDILKQQMDEIRLEKENLRDELKKEVENYQQRLQSSELKVKELEDEIENLKAISTTDDKDKQYRDELCVKDQQLMNAINDLRNANNFSQDLQERFNVMENNMQSCNLQNEYLVKELDDLRHTHNYIQLLTQEIGFATEASLVDKIKMLKDNLLEFEIKFDEAKSAIMEKDKAILNLKDNIAVLEANNSLAKNFVTEQGVDLTQIKHFASEPFRMSTEQSSSDDDTSTKYTESSQGMMKEIQSMKQVLSMKDAEITRLSIALNDAQERLIRNSEEESLRHRLDDALYTLHLRDVRCDELTLELMQLLEERDSLQLKLSTAIRFNEELRQKSHLLDEELIRTGEFSGETDAGISETKGSDEVSHHQLKEKLDQLHNVGYRRDPGMQQDQQKRHLEQMQLYSHQSPQEESQPSGFLSWIFG